MDLLSKEASQIQTLLCRKFITNMKDSVFRCLQKFFLKVFIHDIFVFTISLETEK